MTEWEYRVLLIAGDQGNQETHLLVLGKHGWELVTVLPTGLGANVIAYLKRPTVPNGDR